MRYLESGDRSQEVANEPMLDQLHSKRVSSYGPGMRCLALVLVSLPLVAMAQARVEVQSTAGALDREAAQVALNELTEPLSACFGEAEGTALAVMRISRSGRVASVRLMQLTGDERVDRCLVETLREAEFGRHRGRSTLYVRISQQPES